MEKMSRRQVVRAGVLAMVGGLVGACSNGPSAGALVDPFVDTVGHDYEWAIEEIRLAGLTAGCQAEPPMYCPDRPMTRGEAAVMFARVLRLVK